MRKKIIAAITVVSMLLSSVPAFAKVATRGAVADMLLEAAADYTQGLERSDIIKGYGDGDTKDDQAITRAESFVMVSRAFGELPEPVGNDARQLITDIEFTDVPEWAAADVENLVNAGVLIGDGNSSLESEEPVTEEQVELMIQRIYSLLGKYEKDDFYEAVNKEALNNSEIAPGEQSSGGFVDVDAAVSEQITDIITELVAGEYEQGTKEQKIADFYKLALDIESRNAAGLSPVQEYIDAINEAETLAELLEVDREFFEYSGTRMFADAALGVDLLDSTKYTMYWGAYSPGLTKDMYADEDSEQAVVYKEYIADMLMYLGDNEEEARAAAEEFFAFEKVICESSLDSSEISDMTMLYNPYTPEQLQEIMPGINVEEIITAAGYTVPDTIIVSDVDGMNAFASYLTDENLSVLKTIAKMTVLNACAAGLDQKIQDISNEFQQKFYGTEGSSTTEEIASQLTQSYMSDYIGEKYVERHFSPEAKADVEEMIAEFIEVYKSRINGLDWMSAETKERAIEKLDKMIVKVGYPDNTESVLDGVDIKSADEGGTLLYNMMEISKANRRANAEYQGKTVDKTEWNTPAYTVNAYYDPSANDITFPAGILQAPFYDENAAREENLGGIGVVIAHEITHAFDSTGSQFDADGNVANWWTQEDYQKFSELCQEVIEYYDGYETIPGIITDGVLTLGENIADLGGMRCALEVMKSIPGADYDAFFRSCAECFMMTAPRQYVEFLSQVDTHSYNKVRVNRMCSAMDEFYETYGVDENDGMYVAPEDRVGIW